MNLGPDEFEALLRALDADRSAAGEEYEKLRARLVTFFRWEGCITAEDWADEVLNRVARRIARGEAIQSMPAFVSGVARLTVKEAGRRQARESGKVLEMPSPREPRHAPDERPAQCLERCLASLDSAGRDLILRYYEGEASARIHARQAMAAELGISLNSLRNRALRLRDKLELCVAQCLERDVSVSRDTTK